MNSQPSEPFDCLIDVQSRVKISAATAGMISRVHVARGDFVKAGQMLFELESSLESAQLAIARVRAENDQPVASATATLNLARSNLDRLARLKRANPGAVPDQKLEEAQTEVASALAGMRDAEFNLKYARLEAERAEAQLSLRRIVSPLDGFVIDKAMSVGEYRHEQAHVLVLARIDPLHVEVFAPLQLLNALKIGQRALIFPEAPLGGQYEATVTVIDPVIDAASGTFGVRLTLPNPDKSLPAGLRCRVQFGTATSDVTASVPSKPR